MKINIPAHLGITAAADMPFVDLVLLLARRGYHLRNTADGLEAVPMPDAQVSVEVREYRPNQDEDLFTEPEPPLQSEPREEQITSCCGRKRFLCRCDSSYKFDKGADSNYPYPF